jgi:hypothetical protein
MCDKYGILIYSDSRKNAPAEWLRAYQEEYFSGE